MKQFEGYIEQIVKEFVKNFVDGQTLVHGKWFWVSTKTIAHISSLENKGIDLNENANVTYQSMIELFHREGEPQPVIIITTKRQNKGFHRMSLLEPWRIVVAWIIKYFTYEGQITTVVGPSFHLLIHLCHDIKDPSLRVNLLTFLRHSVTSMIEKYKVGTGPLKHHGLIQLICKYHFCKNPEKKWQKFVRKFKKGWIWKTTRGGRIL